MALLDLSEYLILIIQLWLISQYCQRDLSCLLSLSGAIRGPQGTRFACLDSRRRAFAIIPAGVAEFAVLAALTVHCTPCFRSTELSGRNPFRDRHVPRASTFLMRVMEAHANTQ